MAMLIALYRIPVVVSIALVMPGESHAVEQSA
jgi:hypothetical protein